MASFRKYVFLCYFLAATSWCSGMTSKSEDLIFPEGFMFGAATASYQVEGGWNASDKSPSIWDEFTHRAQSPISDSSTGDIACDSYHHYKQDVQLAKDLGLHFYRFSISWPRLLPSGFDNHISEDGANYYNNLINELLDNGIEPMVTLYHWDLPQRLGDLGGWLSPVIADWFADYARVAYSLFGDRVKYWLTINEAISYCTVGYVLGGHAPGLDDPDVGYYICVKNSVLAHAKAYRVYDEEFRQRFGGIVSIANSHMWFEPKNEEDQELTELVHQYANGIYAHPIFSAKGGWPPLVEEYMAQKSLAQGYSKSRLPAFTDEELKLAQGTHDYYAFNHYTSRLVRKAKAGEFGSFPMNGANELGVIMDISPEWEPTACFWHFVNPVGIRNQLNWIKDNYGDLEIIITENGFPTETAGDLNIHDEDRIRFYRNNLAQVQKAIEEDGVKVIGYTAWTLIDNFEWTDGYTKQFGLYAVDFTDPDRKRYARDSAAFYTQLLKDNYNAYIPETKSLAPNKCVL